MASPNFASARIAQEWASGKLAPLLAVIVNGAIEMGATFNSWVPTLTCIYRTPEENDALYGGHGDHLTGVHVLWRGVDMRIFDAPFRAVGTLTDWANANWIYDPARRSLRVCLLEGRVVDESSGPHLHFQVSPATIAAAT